jgi:histone H3/H4
MQNVKTYLDKSDKYITSYIALKEQLPVDVINYISKMDITRDIVTAPPVFNKGIEDLIITLRPKTKILVSAIDLVNELVIAFLEDVYKKAVEVTYYKRKKLVDFDDINYIIMGFTQENTTLINKMSKGGYKAMENFETFIHRKNEKVSRKVQANTFTDPPKIDQVLKAIVKLAYYSYNKLVAISLAGVLDVLIKYIIVTARNYSHNNTITVNHIIAALQHNLNLRLIFIELYPIYFAEM